MKISDILNEANDRQAAHDARQADIKALCDRLEAQHPGLDIYCYAGTGANLILSKIVVPKDQRDVGLGTTVMTALCAFADQRDLPITLTPDKAYGGSVSRLQAFYRRFGFRPNKGRNKDYRYSESMIRRPL